MSERPRGRRIGCAPILGVTVLFGLLVVVLVFILATMTPSWFKPPDAGSPTVDARASLFEKQFVSELTRVREGEDPWGIRIQEEDLNAWLWVRFPAWVAHLQGAGAFGTEPLLQAELETDHIKLGTDSVVVSLDASVEDRRIHITSASGNAIGRVPLPKFMFERMMYSIDFGGMKEILVESSGDDAFTGSNEMVLPGGFELGDGRTVELLEIQLEDGAAVLIFGKGEDSG